MRRSRSPLALVALLAVAASFLPRSALAQDYPMALTGPPPMEVGTTYEIGLLDDFVPGEVLELTDGPWVRIRFRDEGEMWVNAMFIIAFRELDAEAAGRRPTRRERAYEATMTSDLRNLMSAQEIFYADGGYRYSTSLDDLRFSPSAGVSIEIRSADLAAGYWALARHGGTDIVCATYVGDPENRRAPATEPGVVRCDGASER